MGDVEWNELEEADKIRREDARRRRGYMRGIGNDIVIDSNRVQILPEFFNVDGLPLAEAIAVLEKEGVSHKTLDTNHIKIPRGVVISHTVWSASGGSKEVHLLVSTGQRMPDLIGLSAIEVREQLVEGWGWDVEFVQEAESEYEKGLVYGTFPRPNGRFDIESDRVKVYISNGIKKEAEQKKLLGWTVTFTNIFPQATDGPADHQGNPTLYYSRDGEPRQKFWTRKRVREKQLHTVNVEVKFSDNVRLWLVEDDWPDRDDKLKPRIINRDNLTEKTTVFLRGGPSQTALSHDSEPGPYEHWILYWTIEPRYGPIE